MIYMILAEAAAAKQKAEFDKLLAKKEFQRVEMEAEEERKRQFQRAKFECDKAILSAMKKGAIAETKLKAIKQAIEEGKAQQDTLTTISHLYEPTDTKQQTQAWANTQRVQDQKDCVTESSTHEPETKKKSLTSYTAHLKADKRMRLSLISKEQTPLHLPL